MSIDIRLKHSSVNGKVPQPADLSDGELALNTNAADPAIYLKDSAGAVRRVDAGAVPASDWTRAGTTLSPAIQGDDVVLKDGAGTTTVQLNNDGSATFAGDVQMASQNGGPLAGFRNLLMNGNFKVFQRGTNSPIDGNPADNPFVGDRWQVRPVGGTGSTAVISYRPDGFGWALQVSLTNATRYCFVSQKIEAANCRHLAGKQVTFSFFTDTANPIVGFRAYKTDDSHDDFTVQATPASLGNSRWSATVTLPSYRFGSAENVAGLEVFFYPFGANVPPNGSVFVWDLQLEPGPVATPFEHRPIGTELALCQRYYQTVGRLHMYPYSNSASSATARRYEIPRTVVMRTSPTEAGNASNADPSGISFGGFADRIYAAVTNTDGSNATTISDYTADAEL